MADENQDIASPAPAEDEGITAYHGSPHEFERFDTSKIGTGEGAQAYGHGLYFAENEPIAKSYRDALAPDPRDAVNRAIENIKNSGEPATLDNLMFELRRHKELSEFQNDSIFKKNLIDVITGTNDDNTLTNNAMQALRRLDKMLPPKSKGSMYEVKIKAHPDHFLDWDKPLSDQSEFVKDALNDFVEREKSYMERYPNSPMGNPFGSNIYESNLLVPGKYRDKSAASKALLDRGIVGIKYLDAGSRDKGAGTHNYVVFDDKLLDIKRRYEMGGAVPMASGGKIKNPISREQVFDIAHNIANHALELGYKLKANIDENHPYSSSQTKIGNSAYIPLVLVRGRRYIAPEIRVSDHSVGPQRFGNYIHILNHEDVSSVKDWLSEAKDALEGESEMPKISMSSGGKTGDTQSMPQLTSEQQSLLDQLSRAIDRVYPAMDAAEARQPVIRHEPTMPGEPALTREQHQEYNVGQLQNALARVPTDYPTGPIGYAEGGDVGDNPAVQKALAVTSGVPSTAGSAANFIQNTSNPKRIMVPATGPGGIKGIVIPRHMWEGGNGKHGLIPGLRDINQARAAVYGSQNRDPLTIGRVAEIHKQTLDDHFKLPVDEQIARENEALERLRAAKHIGKSADTLDESEKLDTVRHEYDDQGRPHVGYGSKGIAGYALYSSGHGSNQKFHVLNVCPGSVAGCSGGIDANGIADTSRGTCFAPVAESQYPGAAIRRACHTQAKFDPAMTSDWILAHTGSLRRAAEKADKNGERVLFRPNVVDESDRSSRYAIKHLNDQRKAYSESARLKVALPDIIANSYGKTTELHDPDNGFFVTYSNTGPKTKLGYSVAENIQRDKQRVRSTILAQDAAGRDFVNDDGEETPPKGSYMVTDVKRDSPLDEKMRKAFKYAKYWSAGRPVSSLSKDEIAEGEEAHYDGKGKPTTPEKAHYGHITLNGKRYDYQKQHILHRRLVQVGKNKDGSPHMIPTDSRFKDEEFLPKTRYMTRSGKPAGHILITTPTTSTSNAGHQTAFTHHVNESHIEHASKNKGEYEIDPPAAQEASAGKEYVPPKDVGHFAYGGTVDDEIGEHLMAFPERSHYAQIHNVHRSRHNDEKEIGSKRSHGIKSIDRALRLTSQYNQPTRGRP